MAKNIRHQVSTPIGEQIYRDALQLALIPPSPLTKPEIRYFEFIIRCRDADSWTESERLMAVRLAQIYRQMDEMEEIIVREGRYQPHPESKLTILHPLAKEWHRLFQTVKALWAMLNLRSPVLPGKRGMRAAISREDEKDVIDADLLAK